jgi:Calx-beta domain
VKLNKSLLSSLLSLLLAFAGPAALVAALGTEAPAQDAPAATSKGRWNSDVYVITRGAKGETVCREATPAERRNLMRPELERPGRVLIYPGASRRAALDGVGKAGGPNAVTTDSGQTLLPSAGLQIVLHGTSQLNGNTQARDAFIAAANRWEAIISTQMTVVLDVDFGTTFFGQPWSSPNVLGATGTAEVTRRYSNVRGQLLAAAPAAAEATFYNALPASSVPTEISSGAGSASATRLALPLARALGLTPDIVNPDTVALGDADAGIGFNSAHTFDFNPADGILPNATDFDAVVVHEIGHALGFSSESGIPSAPPTVLDLFRLRPGAASAGNLATVATAQRVMVTGGSQVFFNNRASSHPSTAGLNELGLSTGGPAGNTGDGEQSSHWKADEQTFVHIGIMDPTIADGQREEITENDKLAFDTFGYSFGATVAPPPAPAAQAPPNDNFANAVNISGTSGSVGGDNFDSTGQAGEPNHAGVTATGRRSVWYNWTAPASGQTNFNTQGADYDTVLGIYTGNAVNALTLVGSNDDVQDGVIRHSTVTFSAVAGTTYRIAVDGFQSDTGTFSLNWTVQGAATPTPTPTPSLASTYEFSQASYSVQEHDGSVGVIVKRTGNTSAQQTILFVLAGETAGVTGPPNNQVSFAAGETQKTVALSVQDDQTAEANQVVALALLPLSPNTQVGAQGAALLTVVDDDTFPANSVKFDGPALRIVNESGPSLGNTLGTKVDFTVTRTGNLSQDAFVDYRTFDSSAISTKDYTFAGGTLHFAAGEATKTFSVLITEDFHDEPDTETFNIQLMNPLRTSVLVLENTLVTVQITDNDPPGQTTNPSDATATFVDQHYNDFLNRKADAGGIGFWSDGINSCGANAECRRVKRIDTSAAFFLSIEFQETGYLVYRMYKAAYGDIPNTPIPVRFQDFMRDTQEIGRGVEVGVGNWFAQLEANKAAFGLAFVQRGRFKTALPAELTPTQFIDRLNANSGNLLTSDQRTTLINNLTANNTPAGRAAALRAVADNAALRDAETRKAFVLMQYFGYLRRDPDGTGFDGQADPSFNGFNFWLGKLNQFNGDFRAAEMVKAFIESIEYRQRFGQ